MRKISPASPLLRLRTTRHLALALAMGVGLLLPGVMPLLHAQATGTNDEDSASSTGISVPFWQCISPAGNFTVALKDISSVSVHTYIVDTTARVTELNVGTNGSIVARFYYLEPLTEATPLTTVQVAQDRMRDLANTANARVTGGSAPWENVVKNYPTTTHAHTVEYRLPNKDLINKLFEDAEKAWMTGKGSKVTVVTGGK